VGATGVSKATVSEVLNFRRPPTWQTVKGFVRTCGAEDSLEAWKYAWSRATGEAESTWHFPDRAPITIVCARLPERLRQRMPYADPRNPDYDPSHTQADGEALLRLFGFLHAVNPASRIGIEVVDREAGTEPKIDYSHHLVLLGGVDWNSYLRTTLKWLKLSVRQQRRHEEAEYESYFEVGEGDQRTRFEPDLEWHPDEEFPLLREDVGLFHRERNPYHSNRTLTICNGIFAAGTYGAVRALTDSRFCDANEAALRTMFPGRQSFTILSRVMVANGEVVTPDWQDPGKLLYEWPNPGQLRSATAG